MNYWCSLSSNLCLVFNQLCFLSKRLCDVWMRIHNRLRQGASRLYRKGTWRNEEGKGLQKRPKNMFVRRETLESRVTQWDKATLPLRDSQNRKTHMKQKSPIPPGAAEMGKKATTQPLELLKKAGDLVLLKSARGHDERTLASGHSAGSHDERTLTALESARGHDEWALVLLHNALAAVVGDGAVGPWGEGVDGSAGVGEVGSGHCWLVFGLERLVLGKLEILCECVVVEKGWCKTY